MGDSEDEFRELRWRRQERRRRVQPTEPERRHDGGSGGGRRQRPREAAVAGDVEGGSPGSAWLEPPREPGGRPLAKGRKDDDHDHATRPPPAGRQVREVRPAEQPPDPAAEPGSPGAAGGLVFCQICQKDLSAMNAQRRQQHVNRCLDDLEKLHPPSSSIPECPICGKGFSTLKSRSGHLKRCAIRMEIPPPLLLQAVRQQQATALGSSQPAALRGLKRKVSPSLEQTMEKHKMVKREGLAEDLLVAMATSRTCLAGRETKAKLPTSRRRDGPSRVRKRLKAVREKLPQLPPPLLLQDPEKARQQTEERVALLLAEAEEFPGTPPLPASHLLEVEQSRQAHVASPATLRCSLWEFSSLAGPCAAPGSFCAVGITLPVSPPPTDQRTGPGAAGLVVEQVPPVAGGLQGTVCGELAGSSSTKPAGSQKDVCEALQDLVELAGEGLTLTQWELDVQQGAESGREREPGTVLQSCVVQPLEEELPIRRSCHPTFLLSSLAAAFRGMVNNPHLSDLQFQVDSGEVIYAHMFVLYARCPQLMEVVDHKGFVVAEGGDIRSRRVLLDNVSAEAVRVFLSHLYAGDHAIPLPVLSDVADLAVRFGVPDLAALCRGQAGSGSDGGGEEAGAERAEALEELLTSMWVGENQEAEAMLSWPRPEEAGGEAVGEQDLEEIYAFAATQRKAALSRAGEERGSSESQRRTASEGLEEPTATSGRKADPDPEPEPEPFRLQVQESGREEGVRGRPMEPLGDPKETTGPFGEPETDAVLGGVEDHRPELNESLESLFSRAPGESFELCQQSPDTRGGPSKDPTARRSLSASPGGWELSSGLLSTLPLLVSPPVVSLPGSSPRRRGAFSRDLSLTSAAPPLLPASQSSPCAKRNEAASLGQALGKGPHKTLRSLTLPPPPSHTDLEEEDDDLILLSDSEEEVEPGQEKEQVQAGASGKEPGAPAAISGCVSKEDSEAPLLGMLVRREAAQQPSSQGSERVEDSWVEGYSWGQDDVVPDTPQLGRRGSGGTRGAKPSSESGPEQQWTQVTGGASPPPASWASVQSPKGALSPLALPAAGKSAQGPAPPLSGLRRPAAEVVIVDDSEEELDPAPPPLSWDSGVLGKDLPFSEGGSSSSYLLPSAGYSRPSPSPAKAVGKRGDSPLARTAALRFGEAEVSGSSCQGGAAWDGEDSGDDDGLPLGQQLPASLPLQKTPELACRTREVPCTTPLTPLPSYSIMETPELKKELSRFGVRALPKRQMVSKLKEIFQYTHQSRKADTQDRAAASQPASRCNQAKATQAVVACSTPRKQRSRLTEPLQGGQEGGSCQDPSRAGAGGGLGQRAELHCPQEGSGRPDGATFSPARLPTAGPVLPASQESVESSVSGSDASLVSQSSSLTEFEASMLAEEEEEEEGIPASQAAAREADKLEALRRYIHSKPALSRQILLYQPFELAGLQAELKQNGIRIALGKLLDFLDAHCITFTTAEARREKNREKQQRPKRKGRRRRC